MINIRYGFVERSTLMGSLTYLPLSIHVRGWYRHVRTIWVLYAAVKGMVFKQFTLGYRI